MQAISWSSGPTPPGVDGFGVTSGPVHSGFEPAERTSPSGRRSLRRTSTGAGNSGRVTTVTPLGGTTSVGAQVGPSGAASSGGGRPGPTQQRHDLATGSSRIEPLRRAGRFGRVIRHSQAAAFGQTPHPVSATRAERGACKRNRPSGHARFGARRARRAASQSSASVDGRPITSVGGRTVGHDQGGPSVWGASKGAAGASAPMVLAPRTWFSLLEHGVHPSSERWWPRHRCLGSVRLTCQRLPTRVDSSTGPSARR